MKVVHSGYIGSNNAGDEILLRSLLSLLDTMDPDLDVVTLSKNPTETTEMHGVKAIHRYALVRLMRELGQADLLISGGGSLFQDQTSVRNVLYYAGILCLGRITKTPTFLYAHGIGPVRRKRLQRLIAWVVNQTHTVTVRDETSKRELQKWGVRKVIHVLNDSVFLLTPSFDETRVRTNKIALSLRDASPLTDDVKELAQVFDKLVDRGKTLLFIAMHSPQDYELQTTILHHMKHRTNVEVLHINATLEEKWAAFSSVDYSIGMRLHALIFSAAQGKPFIPISYDPKIDALADQFSIPVTINTTTQDFSHQLQLAVDEMEVHYAHFELQTRRLAEQFKQHNWELGTKLIKGFLDDVQHT